MQNGLGILTNSLPFKSYMNSVIAIDAVATLLTLPDLLGKWQISCRDIHFDIVIEPPWYLEELAHLAVGVPDLMLFLSFLIFVFFHIPWLSFAIFLPHIARNVIVLTYNFPLIWYFNSTASRGSFCLLYVFNRLFNAGGFKKLWLCPDYLSERSE